LLTHEIKRFLNKIFARNATIANKELHAKRQPTRGWMQKKCMNKILVTEIAMV